MTESLTLSPDTLKSLQWLIAILITDYAAVVLAVIIDLVSGIYRARREGQKRTSRGYRRSVDKGSRYLFSLIALSVIDILIVSSSMLFRSTMGWSVPVFPFFTTLGALFLAFIEGKSVVENTQRRSDFTEAARSASALMSDPDLQRLIDSLRSLLGELKR